jgi:hypothetical protein
VLIATFTLVALADVTETVPCDVAESHVPPGGVVATVAVQFSVLAQAPLAVIFTDCDGSEVDCPAMPEKRRARGEAVIAHGACTTKVTAIICGLPLAMLPFPSVPVKLTVPLYVPGVSPDASIALIAIDAD